METLATRGSFSWGWQAPHSHNGYLEFALGCGIPAVAVLVLALVKTVAGEIRAARTDPAAGVLAGLLVNFMLENLTENSFPVQNTLFWIMISMAMVHRVRMQRMPRPYPIAQLTR